MNEYALRQHVPALFDQSLSVDERLDAANEVITTIDAGRDVPSASELVLKALASKTIEELSAVSAPNRDLWRAMVFPDPNEVAPELALPIANILYERTEHDLARRFYEIAGDAGKLDARGILLKAYNLEGLARQTREEAAAREAYQLLESAEVTALLAANNLEAERLHALGHIATARAIVAGQPAGHWGETAVANLEQAARLDPSYTACFTSVFSELGDYLRTVAASLDLAADGDEWLGRLEPDDRHVVRLEVLFYLAHALTCVGEFERGLFCLRQFASHVPAQVQATRYDAEPQYHADLFTVRAELKRNLLHETSKAKLEQWLQTLHDLSFVSRPSRPVERERKLNIRVVEYLVELRAALDGDIAAHGRAVNLASQILEALASDGRASARPAAVIVHDEHAANDVAQRLGDLEPLVTTGILNNGDIPLDGALFVAVVRKAGAKMPEPVAAAKRRGATVLDYATVDTGRLNSRRASNGRELDAFYDHAIVGAALAASRWFLLDDSFAFALIPCNHSPALRYQRPEYGWESLV